LHRYGCIISLSFAPANSLKGHIPLSISSTKAMGDGLLVIINTLLDR